MENNEIQAILRSKNTYIGLSSEEALARLKTYGYNLRPKKIQTGWIKRFLYIFSEPMMLLIIAAVIVYFFIGELVEALIFLCAIVPIGLMSFFQQRRTDKAVAELDKMLEEWSRVYRNKQLITENVKKLVPGDLVHLSAGDKVPADGFILSGNGLQIDESVLTGESVPVTKNQIPEGEESLGNSYKLFQGTLVTQGEAKFLVVYTGLKTEYGQLGSLLEKIVKAKTPLQKKIGNFIRSIAIAAVSIALIVGLALYFMRGLHDGFVGGLTMGMSLIPEEFPIVFSVFMVMGIWRMARKNSLVREMATIETLGSATVVCADKTGTITEGRMSFIKAFYRDKILEANNTKTKNEVLMLVKEALLSLERVAYDPLEVEVHRYAKESGVDPDNFFSGFDLIIDGSFDSRTKMVHHIWREQKNKNCFQHTVGAPEAVIAVCDMPEDKRNEALKINESFASQGLRVIALAKKECDSTSGIEAQGLIFVGLIAMSDPPRPRVNEAIKMCQEAGIRVIMITGDNKLTAHTIAEKIGLKHRDEILDAGDLQKMSPAAMRLAVDKHDIFARVRPEQKFLIVEALQQNGEVVAMTGDGVNDAPALKKADIGVAMGQKGTEVAREAADMILLDDNFFTIARAVKEGRKIYRNLQQAFAFLISFHLPIIAMAVVPLLFGEPLIFLPIHIIFLELICDPASVLGFENEKAPRNIMRLPPRPPKEPLIPVVLWGRIIVHALAIFAVSFGYYYYFSRYTTLNHDVARTVAFVALAVSQVMAIFMTREWFQIRENLTLTGISIGTWAAIMIIIFVPVLRSVFHFAAISPTLILSIFVVSFVVIGAVSVPMRLLRRT